MQYLTVSAFVTLLIVQAQSSCSGHCSNDQAQIAVNYANGNGMVSIAPMHTNDTLQACSSERFSHTVQGFIVSHRLAYAFVSFTVVNLITTWSERKVLAVPWAKHLSPVNLDMAIAAQTRVIFAPILLLGFLVALYRWLTGCSLAGVYIYSCACWSGVADAWEWVRRWPLPGTLILHHFGVLSLLIAIAEFKLFPVGGEWSFALVLFFANTGLQWMGDFMLRSSLLAREIKSMDRARNTALWSAVPRAINAVLLAWNARDAFQARAWLALAMTIPLNIGYVVTNVRVIYWAYCFEPAEYFAKHQQLWLAAESPAAVPEGAGGAAQMHTN